MENKELIEFLKSQKLLVLSTVDKDGEPWVSNVYYSVDGEFNLFFVSPADTKHIEHLEHNPKVAFSIAWFDPDNLVDRKGIQGQGTCERIIEPKEMMSLLKNHAKYFPLWRDLITYENIKNRIIQSKPYLIKPSYIKFWNDELYGKEGTKEFTFE